MKYFYLNNEHLKNGYPAVLLMQETSLENYEIDFLNKGISAREYLGEYLPERLIYDENLKSVRIPTEQECYDLDPSNYVLREDAYYIKSGEVKLKPEYRKDMLKPIFNPEKEVWEESATKLEIKNYEDSTYREFYYRELNDFNKATMEFQAGILTQKQYEECQEYIRFLNSQLNTSPKMDAKKPIHMNY